jgi:tetrapyrrole methylase family protein / MazG family protein
MGARPRVVVAGIGPAGPDQVTAEVLSAIGRIPHRFLRTRRHPAASVVSEAESFDEIYDRADTFDEVYLTIVENLVASATMHSEVLYVVPGSPLVLERSVRYLLADDRVDVTVLAGMSFLDLAYARLKLDPIEARLTLIDGHLFTTASAGCDGAMLVAHCHNQRVLSDIKLSLEDGPDVTVLQRLGLPDEHVATVPWNELDREVEADHLTSIFIPAPASPVGSSLLAFHETVRRLREECPWDKEQTHDSLLPYLRSEVDEAAEAIGQLGADGEGDEEFLGELGDVLLQVVLHSAIAEQQGRFTLGDVAATVNAKMIRRHPHVFGDVVATTPDDVSAMWESIKASERAAKADATDDPPSPSS